jgi:hypothetical protein
LVRARKEIENVLGIGIMQNMTFLLLPNENRKNVATKVMLPFSLE